MRYMLLIYGDEQAYATRPKAAQGEVIAAYEAYMQALGTAGVMVGGARLANTHSASCVRVQNGKTQVLDGPYAETKEQLGGYFLIDVENLDAALAWASRCPGAAHGTVEVRPLWQGPM